MRKFRSSHHERKPKEQGQANINKKLGTFIDFLIPKKEVTGRANSSEKFHDHHSKKQLSITGIRSPSVEQKKNFKKAEQMSAIEEVVNRALIKRSERKNEENEKIIQDTIVTILQSKISISQKNEYARDSEIQIQDKNQEIILWLGQLYTKCASAAFSHFIKGELNYREVKTFCCEQILKNLIAYMKSKTIQPEDMKIINEESIKILSHLCNKYPRTDTVDVNKKVKEIVQQLKINNWENDQFDIFDKSQINLRLKDNGDYSEEIMGFLNYLITLPYKEHSHGLTNFKYFEKVMNKIFSVIYYKKDGKDLERIVGPDGKIDIQSKLRQKKTLTEEEIEYIEKVNSYTYTSIGTKISENTHVYSDSDIQSGFVKINSPSVARILDKWTEQLQKKFEAARQGIKQRIYRFKGVVPGTKHKVPIKEKQNLFQIIQEKKKQLEKFVSAIKNNICQLTYTLMTMKESDVSSLRYIPESERQLGQFAVKMCQASSQYFIMTLNKQIHLLLEAVEDLKRNWKQEHTFTQSPFYEQLNINLVTFKLGDLMRCRIISHEQEIGRILKVIKDLNQNWQTNEIKIIRVKDRLDTGNRDVLINFMFQGVCPCQIQLACGSSAEIKQSYFDKFNHFLYEIKRAYLGPIMQMSEIWTHHENKAETFVQTIKTENKIKEKKREKKYWPQNINIQEDKIQRQIFPFVCTFCQIFYPGQKIFYWDVKWKNKVLCGTCISKKMIVGFEKTRGFFIFQDLIKQNRNCIKTLDYLIQVKSFQQIKNHTYFVFAPYQSRKISLKFVKKIKTNSRWGLFWNQFKDGKIIEKMCSVAYDQVAQHLEKYTFFTWNLPIQEIPIMYKNRASTELLRNYISIIKEKQASGEAVYKCSALKFGENIYYLPILTNQKDDLQARLNLQKHRKKIQDFLGQGKQIFELSQSDAASEQFTMLPLPLQAKMNQSIKQLYLNQNKLCDINFISKIIGLKIFHAQYNSIKAIPELPPVISEIILTGNKLISLKGLEMGVKLKTICFSKNMITQISHIERLTNLQNLYLFNNQIKKIENIPQSAIKLGLQFNKIKRLENLQSAPLLEQINVSGNEISSVEEIFKCKSLKILFLNKNDIKCIKGIENLQKLQILHVSDNSLHTNFNHLECYSCRAFSCLFNLKKCHLKFNRIHSISTFFGVENELSNIIELALDHNQIVDIQKIHQIFPQLQQLDLSFNNITSITEIMKIPTLKFLKLSNNHIQDLPQLGWQIFIDVRILDFSHNTIKKIPNLEFITQYEQINFSHNKINEIQKLPQIYSSIFNRKARVMNLSHNRLFEKQITPKLIPVLNNLQHNLTVDLSHNEGAEKVINLINKQYLGNVKIK